MNANFGKDRDGVDTKDMLNALLDELRSLKAADSDGFEGLIRDLLESLCGRTFRLVKSGPQHGKDILSDRDKNAPMVAIESKRFGSKTGVDADELQEKLRDVLEHHPDVDVWALAYSREMKEPDWSNLEAIADKKGVALSCLDWREAPGTLPRIAALCAQGWHLVAPRLKSNLSALRAQIVAHPDFDRLLADIKGVFTEHTVGFALAQHQAAQGLRSLVTSASTARQLLGSYADIRSSEAHFIERKAVSGALDAWWSRGCEGPCALLGAEGMGKTWAGLNWCLQKTAHAEGPLVVIASAKEANDLDPPELIAKCLKKLLPDIDEAQLMRRVVRWATAHEGPPKVILLVDGLNENFNASWREFTQRFEDAPWKTWVGLILTCRTEHWHHHLVKLDGATEKPITEVSVEPFTDAEVHAFLQSFGLSKADLSAKLLELIRTPRLAKLAVRLRHELKDKEGVTSAHIVLEDWRSRLSAARNSTLRLTDEQLLDFVAQLGRSVRDDKNFAISQREIYQRLSEDSGLDFAHYAHTISELIDGHWLTKGKKPHQYALNAKLLPFAVGLDLAATAARLKDVFEVREAIAEVLEQLRGADIGVGILRAAAAISILRQDVSDLIRKEFLSAWFEAQNLGHIDFREFWPLIGHNPELFIAFAHERWSGGPQHVPHQQHEFLAKALAHAAQTWTHTLNTLVEALPSWVGAMSLKGDEWFFGHARPDAEQAERQTAERLAVWKTTEQGLSVQPSIHFAFDRPPRLAAAALSIVSYLPRAKFRIMFLTWGVSRAIMGRFYEEEAIAWVLRLNDVDFADTESALIEMATALQALNSITATEAADALLRAVATSRALAHARSIPELPKPLLTRRVQRLADGSIAWTATPPEDASPARVLADAAALAKFATDPAYILGEAQIERLKWAAAHIDAGALWSSEFDGVGHLRLEEFAPCLARWAPTEYVGLLNRLYAHPPSVQGRSLDLMRPQPADCIFALNAECRAAMLQFGLAELEAGRMSAGKSQEELRHIEWRAQDFVIAGLCGQTATAQLYALEALPNPLHFSRELNNCLSQPCAADLARVLRHLESAISVEALRTWLSYLLAVYLEHIPDSVDILLSLTAHQDAPVRGLAMQLVVGVQFDDVGAAFCKGPWRYAQGQANEEALYGSYILCKYGADFPFEDIRARIAPQTLPFMVQERGCREAELGALYEEVASSFIRTPGKPRVVHAFNIVAADAWNALVKLKGQDILALFKEAVTSQPLLGFFDSIPLVELMKPMFVCAPQETLALWREIKHIHSQNSFTHSDFECLPFVFADSPEVNEVRLWLLSAAKSDKDLATLAEVAMMHGREAWVLDVVRNGLSSGGSGEVARALILAGWLDSTSAAAALWSEINTIDLPGWLGQVRGLTESRYRRNELARHWFDAFLATRDPVQAFSAFALFQECVDARVRLWGLKTLTQSKDECPSEWTDHWYRTASTRKQLIDKAEKGTKDVLFGTRTDRHLAPWL